jgi:hypothetical protein
MRGWVDVGFLQLIATKTSKSQSVTGSGSCVMKQVAIIHVSYKNFCTFTQYSPQTRLEGAAVRAHWVDGSFMTF